jgi:hypothetical protein
MRESVSLGGWLQVVGLCCMALLVANTYAKSAVQRFAHRPYLHAALRYPPTPYLNFLL